MGYGNGTGGGKQLGLKPAKRIGRYKKQFKVFAANVLSTRGNCKVTCDSRRLRAADGTMTYRTGSSYALFTSDDGRTVIKFKLPYMTRESVSRGAHLITFSA